MDRIGPRWRWAPDGKSGAFYVVAAWEAGPGMGGGEDARLGSGCDISIPEGGGRALDYAGRVPGMACWGRILVALGWVEGILAGGEGFAGLVLRGGRDVKG